MTSIDMLIKSTIQKFASTNPQVDLDKIAALLEMKPEILLFKLERMIFTGIIQGRIDKKAHLFITEGSFTPLSSSPQTQNLPEPIQHYSDGQTAFIKAKTSETSQEDFIKLDVNLGYLGSHIRFTIRITNKSDFLINEIEMKLEFSHKMELFRATPKLELMKSASGIVVQIPPLLQKQSFEGKFYLNPETLGKGKISGHLKFLNYKGYIRLLLIDEMEYNLTIPKILPKEVSPEIIEQFNTASYMKKDIRSYGLPDKLNPITAFNHIVQIIRSRNFSLLTKIIEEDRKIAWFFGVTEDAQYEILVVGQVINDKIEFYASSANEQILSALLTSFSMDLKRRILISNVVSQEKDIYDLFCVECGGTLPYFPKPGEFVECKYCKTRNFVR